MAKDEFTSDGYKIIKPLPPAEKGVQCGVCNMKFDHDKAYVYVCDCTNCPMSPNITR